MMKKILLLFLFSLAALCSAVSQDIVNLRMTRVQQGLRGAVATVDEDHLVRKDYFREDWPSRKWFKSDLRQFLQEENGRIMTFRNNGNLASVAYTVHGNVVAQTSCSYASNGLLSSFTGEGYKMEAKYKGSSADINVYAETRSYGKDVNLAHGSLSGAEFKTTYPFAYKCRQELSQDGLVLRSAYYYVDSVLARECTYVYSYLGKVVEERQTDYSQDPQGRLTVISATYDDKGNILTKTVRSDSHSETYTYVNNSYGDCVELTVARPYGTVVYTYDYEYDSVGNWTMQLCFQDGVFDNATLRQISYFKIKKSKADSKRGSALLDEDDDYYYDDVATPVAKKSKADKKKAKKAKADKADKKKDKKAKADKKKDKKAKADKKKDKAVKADKADKKKDKKAKAAKADKKKDKKAKAAKADKKKDKKAKADKADKKKAKKAKADKADKKKDKKAKADKADKKKAKKAKADKKNKVKSDDKKAAKQAAKEQKKREKAIKKEQKKAEKQRQKAEKAAKKARKAKAATESNTDVA